MKKEKFVYNPKSLTFERYRAPISKRMLQGISFLMAVVMTASGLLYLFMQYRPSPKEQSLMQEIDQMKIKYSSLNEQLNVMSAVLGNIQDRDASVHRMIFGMDPINKDVWNVGIGGHNRYGELTNYENSSDLLVNTLEKADKLARQMTIQSRSLDSSGVYRQRKGKIYQFDSFDQTSAGRLCKAQDYLFVRFRHANTSHPQNTQNAYWS